jgi:signal transduction histidine kinase
MINARATGLQVELHIAGEPVELAPGLDLTAYRIIQESVTNTLKHATAHRIDIHLTYRPAAVDLIIADDGTQPVQESSDTGHGLVGIRERAALFGGTASAGPVPNGGWVVQAHFPIDAPEPAREAVS